MGRLAVLLGLMASQTMASPIAEIICAPTPEMEQRLALNFGASRTALGMRSHEQLMELWTAPHGDWVLVASYAAGKSCILAMGEDWQTLGPERTEG